MRRVQLSGITATGGCFGGTNGHQIVVADPPDVACSKSDQGLGATRGSDEFHLDGIGQVDIHDCAQIAAFSAPEPEGPCSARRHQACGSSPAFSTIRGYEPRHVAASWDKPDADDDGRLPGRSIQDSASCMFLAPIRRTRRLAVLGQVLDAQCLGKFLPAVL